MPLRAGFVGLGNIGRPMAERLVAGGLETTVHDRFEPPVREQFTKLGIQPAPMKLEEFARFVRSEIEVYRKIVQQANIQLQ